MSDEAMSNFTPRAQQVLALARKEADRFNHNFLGTEHLLLGLIKLGQGVAVNVLQKMGLDLETVRMEVEKQVGTGPDQKMIGNIPYTPRVKKVLALAAKEAKALNHTYVGTEHILLGLLREGDGVAARVLKNLDVDIEQTRQEILKELDPNFAQQEESTVAGSTPVPTAVTPPKSQGGTAFASPQPPREPVDTSKRYDIYCTNGGQEVIVYRNARFKGMRRLFHSQQNVPFLLFVELEQSDGQIVCVARTSITRFNEHVPAPGPEGTPGENAGG
jgi:ATP-dependent Clp protease ATP-binding subunit ClpA